MVLRGGVRDRMILESFLRAVQADLTTQGWFDGTIFDTVPGVRQHRPIIVVDEQPQEDDEVALNTLAFSYGVGNGNDAELGSNAEEHEMSVFVDFFAESDALGRHLVGDIYAFLRETPHIPVFDYRVATPTLEFHAEVDDVEKRKPARAVNPWQKHWYVVSATLTDDRAN